MKISLYLVVPEKIKISIPTPCHENWQDMKPVDKGRCCASCQKNVVDFTGMADREVARILKADKNTCGRFLETQLNRELITPTEKGKLWMAASVAAISFIGLGTGNATAQQILATEQLPAKTDVPADIPQQQSAPADTKNFTGTVTSKGGKPLKGIAVTIKNTSVTTITGEDGKFTIKATAGDILHITGYNITGTNVAITKHTPDNLIIKASMVSHVMGSPRYF